MMTLALARATERPAALLKESPEDEEFIRHMNHSRINISIRAVSS
jgi:hypothetical protein